MGVLRNTVIAIIGTLPHPTKQIQQWIERNGGRYSTIVTQDVTHLLASKEAYKSRSEAVEKASSLGIQTLSYDWFEDSLQARRQLGTKRYLWKVLSKERRVSKQLKRSGPQADSINFRKGCKEINDLTGTGTCDIVAWRKPRKSKSFFFSSSARCVLDTPFVSAKEDLLRRRAERATTQEKAEAQTEATHARGVEHEDTLSPTVGTTSRTSNTEPAPSPCVSAKHSSMSTQAKITHWKDGYHYYEDATGFEYKVCLLRSDFSCNGAAKYHIGLLESHSKPHAYWTIVHYQPAKKSSLAPNTGNGGGSDDDNKKDTIEEHITLLPNSAHTASPAATPKHQNKDTDKDQPPLPTEAIRLTSLIAPSAPNPCLPYTGEVCPRNSAFDTALRAFRHAFRDLTLLAWEDRFASSGVQMACAQRLGCEPFVYRKPQLGMPVGLFPQASGGGRGGKGEEEEKAKEKEEEEKDGYVRGALGFPCFERGLDANGRFGVVVVRERERERLVREKEEEEEEKKKRKRGGRGGRLLDGREGKLGRNGRVGKMGDGVNGRGFVAPEFEHLLPGGGRKR